MIVRHIYGSKSSWRRIYSTKLGLNYLPSRNQEPFMVAKLCTLAPSTFSTEQREIVTIMNKLDCSLFSPGTASADSVIEYIRRLAEEFKIVVPLCYYMGCAQMLAYRHDATRLELLLRIAESNLPWNELSDSGTRSNPNPENGMQMLVSYSVASLLRHSSDQLSDGSYIHPSLRNHKNEEHQQQLSDELNRTPTHRNSAVAQELWLRMSKLRPSSHPQNQPSPPPLGASRPALGLLLDRLISPTAVYPSLSDLQGLQSSLQSQLWLQSPAGPGRLLLLHRQLLLNELPRRTRAVQAQLLGLGGFRSDWRQELLRLEAFLEEAGRRREALGPGEGGVELRAIRLRCMVAQLGELHRLAELALAAESGDRDRLLAQCEHATSEALREWRGLQKGLSPPPLLPSSPGPAPLQLTQSSPSPSQQSSLTSPSSLPLLPVEPLLPARVAEEVWSILRGHSQEGRAAPLSLPPQQALWLQPRQLRAAFGDLLTGLARAGRLEAAAAEFRRLLPLALQPLHGTSSSSSSRGGAGMGRRALAEALRTRAPLQSARLALLSACNNAASNAASNEATASPGGEGPRWLGQLLCEVARAASPLLPLLRLRGSEKTVLEALRTQDDLLRALANDLQRLALCDPSFEEEFLVARIQGVAGLCEQAALSLASADTGPSPLGWEAALRTALRAVDAVPDSEGRWSPSVLHALLSLLSGFGEAPPLRRALQLLARAEQEAVRVLPASYCLLADTAAACLPDRELTPLLQDLLDRAQAALVRRDPEGDEEGQRPLEAAFVQGHIQLARSRTLALARQAQGFQALQQLHHLRSLGGGADRRLYEQVLLALYRARPQSEQEWRLAKDPTAVADWLLREMLRDGLQLDQRGAALLQALFTKACQIARRQGSPTGALRDMEEFASGLCMWGSWRGSAADDEDDDASDEDQGTHYLGHRRLRLADSPLVVRELLRTYLVAGRDDLAHGLLRASPQLGLQPTAALYEPLVFKYAALLPKAQGQLAEELYLQMVNKGVLVSDAVVSSLVLNQLRWAGGLQEAVDRMQDLFNQHRVRPTVNTVLLLLDAALQAGDVFEARRVVGLVRDLYSPLERATLKGMRLVLPAKEREEGEEDEEREEQRSILSRDTLPGHRIHLGQPPGEGEPAVLSESALNKRFVDYGLTLR